MYFFFRQDVQSMPANNLPLPTNNLPSAAFPSTILDDAPPNKSTITDDDSSIMIPPLRPNNFKSGVNEYYDTK